MLAYIAPVPGRREVLPTRSHIGAGIRGGTAAFAVQHNFDAIGITSSPLHTVRPARWLMPVVEDLRPSRGDIRSLDRRSPCAVRG